MFTTIGRTFKIKYKSAFINNYCIKKSINLLELQAYIKFDSKKTLEPIMLICEATLNISHIMYMYITFNTLSSTGCFFSRPIIKDSLKNKK